MKRKQIIILITGLILLIIISIATQYYGSTDTGDYSDIAKYLSGTFQAKIRLSHSALYGSIMSPLIKLTKNQIPFKIASLIFLIALIFSVYYTTKSKKALFLMLFSPIIWYMGPWISPIQLASLLFFWAYYSIKKYKDTEKIRFIWISGILGGLSWAFWDGIMFFIFFLGFAFLYDKKFYHFLVFLFSILIGLLPRLILDQLFFGFSLVGIARYFSNLVIGILYGGMYGQAKEITSFIPVFAPIILALPFIPYFVYKLFSKKIWKDNIEIIIFLIPTLLLLIKQTQIRYLLFLVPILIYEIGPKLNINEVKKNILLSLIIILIITTPYIIQIKAPLEDYGEFSSFILNIKHLNYANQEEIIENVNKIANEFPNSIFVVGNQNDDYRKLASVYWGKEIKEFVSIEDYNLYLKNESIIFQKSFMPQPTLQDRRQVWISGGINKNKEDKTNYNAIKYTIGINEPIQLKEFKFIKQYGSLYLSKKEE